MRILMLSDTERQGGAGIAAARLAEGLAQCGCEVVRVVRDPDPDSGACPAGPWRRVVFAPEGYAWYKVPAPGAERAVLGDFCRVLRSLRPDAVSVHNIHGGLRHGFSPEIVRACAKAAPTLWTLHDMWSFTGRCTFDAGCDRFAGMGSDQGGCGADCASWQDYPRYAPACIAEAQAAKRAVIADCPNLVAVAPSAWMAEQARRGGWPSDRVRTIANGLDLERYCPGPEGAASAARSELGLDAEGPVLLAVAQHLGDPRKGMDLLAAALRLVRVRPLTLLLMGADPPEMGALVRCGVRVVHLGTLAGADKVRAYRAADLYLHPAREDNQPNTVVEAQACGTPCVAFDVGGLGELVVREAPGLPGGTGLLAGELGPEAFARAVEACLEKLAANDCAMARACRERAKREHDLKIQAEQYVEASREFGVPLGGGD